MKFPERLKNANQWLVWKFESKPGDKKPRKVPYYVNGARRAGKQGDSSDRNALAPYKAAQAVLSTGDYEGLGFAFLPGDGLIGIDIDSNADKKTAAGIIAACASYTETSPSGNGWHIIVEGSTKTFKNNEVGIEVFCGSQFFTMTGKAVPESVDAITPIPERVLSRLREVVKPENPKAAPKKQVSRQIPDRMKLESALAYISADMGYHDWIKIGMAIYSELGPSAMDVWDNWSRKGAGYQESAMAGHWRSFSGNTVTGATIYRMAIDAGWRPPKDPNWNPEPSPDHEVPRILTTSIDMVTPFPDCTDKGKPLATLENLHELLRRIGATVRYNVINKQLEILIPGAAYSIDNNANASLANILSWCNRVGMGTGNVGDYLLALGDRNPYNPVANWILSREWDGQSRMNAIYETLKERTARKIPDGRRLRDVLVMRWMISAIAAVFEPNGVSAHGVLVLQGDQYIGKTKWLKSLAPKELSVIKDGITLNPSDKDSVMLCLRNWIVELGELDASFRKADIAHLKSFITSDRDVLRRPYARLESEYARRTVFFASVNPREFLHDPTGNRRFWTIECEHIDHTHNLDMQQVWAECYHSLYRNGVSWMLEPEELATLNDHNERYTTSDPVYDLIDESYCWDMKPELWSQRMTATEICMDAGMLRPSKADINNAAAYIRKRYKVESKVSRGYSRWLMPPLTSEAESRKANRK